MGVGLRSICLTTPCSHYCFPSQSQSKSEYLSSHRHGFLLNNLRVMAVKGKDEDNKEGDGKGKGKGKGKERKQSLLEALDFSQVRSEKDAQLLDDARGATKSGERMSREQYGALRRKIGGTYKDFFKSYVDVDGEYVEEGWVDKTCKICKKDTNGEPRQVDKLGRYAHLSCLDTPNSSSNFFTRLFSR